MLNELGMEIDRKADIAGVTGELEPRGGRFGTQRCSESIGLATAGFPHCLFTCFSWVTSS